MELVREAKLAKSAEWMESTVDYVSPEPTTSDTLDESSSTTFVSHEGTAAEQAHTESAESLDESFRVSVTTQLSDYDSSEWWEQ